MTAWHNYFREVFHCRIVLFLGACLLAGCETERPGAPGALREERKVIRLGVAVSDPYAWMARKERRAELLAHIAEENAYADRFFLQSASLQRKLMEEFGSGGASEARSSVYRSNGAAYWRESRVGSRYPVYMRESGAGAEVLLNVDAEAQGFEYFELGHFHLDAGQDRLLFTRDVSGDQLYEIAVKDLPSGQTSLTGITRAGSAAYWDPEDEQAFYYLAVAEPDHQSRSLLRHDLESGEATLLYEETDPAFQLRLFNTDGQLYLVTERARENGIWLIDGRTLRPLAPREAGALTRISKQGDELYILSNWLSNRLSNWLGNRPGKRDPAAFTVYRARVQEAGDLSAWTALYTPEKGNIEDFEVLPRHLAVLERSRMTYAVRVLERDGGLFSLKLPDAGDVVSFGASGGKTLRFKSSALIKPELAFEYDLATRELTTRELTTRELATRKIATGGKSPFNSSAYEMKRIWFTANDGTEVPITIAYARAGPPLHRRAMLVTAYGAYGINAPIGFASHRRSLLDRGMIYAVIHVRGGGELGLPWHLAATGVAKQTSLDDFLAGVRFLEGEGYGDSARLVARGASAGGTLVAAAMLQNPERFAAVVAAQPFVDLLNTLSDDAAPLSRTDRLEWGDPTTSAGFASVRKLSPYENVKSAAYPPLLVSASLNDSRVAVHEPLKWVAKLRYHHRGDAPLLIDIDMNSGHRGASDKRQRHLAKAREYAFILDAVGLAGPLR